MKLVFITGAGRGIGRAIALSLAKNGYAVRACSRSQSELRSLETEAEGEIRTRALDVCDEDAVQNWFAEESREGSFIPWGLLTVAGIHGAIDPLHKASWSEWKQGVEVNLFGSAFAAKCFSELLLERRLPGRILLFSGGGATKPIPNLSSYCASKAGLVRFAETLALELSPHSIRVNAIAPGAVNTALTQTILEAGPERAGRNLFTNVQKQARDPSHTPEKAVALVEYLLEESSSPISGRLISAVWDEWRTLHEQHALLENPDIYTLRRLTPVEADQ